MDGFLHYRIPEELIEILRNSEVYARLKTQGCSMLVRYRCSPGWCRG
jgi:hypothetical protein